MDEVLTSTEPMTAAQFAPRLPAQPVRSRRGPWIQAWTASGFEWNVFDLPIAQLSDLHFRPYWTRAYDQVIERLRLQPPDLLLLTGDFIDAKHNHRPAIPFVRRFLSQLTSRIGTFAILGNHDGDQLGPKLIDCGLTLLDGRCARLQDDSTAIEIIGLPGVDRSDLTADLLNSLRPRQPGVPRITLTHFPDNLTFLPGLESDLIFAGHTHGGQICLPGGFPLLSHDALPRRFSKGVHRVGPSWFIINKGLGFSGTPLRLFCPAEIVEVRLCAGSTTSPSNPRSPLSDPV